MPRKLTPEDIELWKKQLKDVKPLRKPNFSNEKPREVSEKLKPSTLQKASPKRTIRGRDHLIPSPSFDRKEYRHVKIESRLDLHGMNFEEAQRALNKFILRAQEKGFKTILIITGKGSISAERTIRQYLPRWLEEAPLRSLIESFHYPAKPRHGGHGAYYVRIRHKQV